MGSASIVIVAGTEAVPPRLVTVMVTEALVKFCEADHRMAGQTITYRARRSPTPAT